jgi:pimeloyl-ACP methyl ester carboxylesterase
MMRFVRTLATALVAISMAAASAAAQTDATPEARIVLAQAKKSSAPRHTGTQVYLLRGFMDIFSTGMDDLGTKLSRRGIRASVHNHSEFQNLANAIGERHKRGIRENVVIIGHSLGANDAFRMAERLNDFGITVPLIIAYDPTATMSVPRNVSRVVNFYSSTNGWGVAVARGPGFRGTLSNVDLSRRGEMGHTDIDKSPALHSQSIGYVQSIGGSRSRSDTATAAPKPSGQESSAKPSEKSDEVKTAAAKDESADSADAKKESAGTETKSAAVNDSTESKNDTAEKKESADNEPMDKNGAAKAASAPAAKDATSEITASVPAKDTEAKETGKDSPAAAKPANGKTETAESKTAEPATSN